MALNTSPTRTRNRVSPQTRLEALAAKGAALYERAERGDPMGPRELAQACEYHQQYINILAEMERMPLEVGGPAVTVEIDERRVRFPNIDKLADWLAEVMD
jgi:hypothetical protein